MLRSIKILLLVAALAALLLQTIDAPAAPTCTTTWDRGAGSSSWHDAQNWSANAVPGASDHVCLPDLTTGTEVVVSAGSTTVASIQAAGAATETLRLSGGTLAIQSASEVDRLLQTGGSLTGAGVVTVDTFTWRGGEQTTPPTGPNANLPGTGATVVTRAMSIEDSSPTWVPNSANDTKDLRRELRIAQGATGEVKGRNGTGTTGRLNLSGLSARFVNHGTLTIRDDQDVTSGTCCPDPPGPGSMLSTGTIVKAAGVNQDNGQPTGDGESVLDVPMEVDGVVDVQKGTLRMDGTGAGVHNADFRVADGSGLRWNRGTHVVDSTQGVHRTGATGTARGSFTGGHVTFNAPYAMQQTTFGPSNAFGAGTAVFNGTTVLGPLTLSEGRAELNGPTTASTLFQTGGTLGGTAAVSFTEMTWRGGEQDTPPSGPNRNLPGTGVTTVTGTLSIEDSSPTWVPNSANDTKDLRRELRIAQGATATLGGRNGTGTTGRLNLSGLSAKLTNAGRLTIKDDQDLVTGVCCPTPGGTGSFRSTGTLVKAAGTDANTGQPTGGGDSLITVPMELDGVVEVDSGTLAMAHNGLAPHGADFRVAPGTTLRWDSGTHVVDSAQGVHRDGATGAAGGRFLGGTVDFDAPYTLQQTTVDGGTARFNGTTAPGPLTISDGRADFNGTTTTTTLMQTGGTLGGSGVVTFDTVTWRGGEQDTPKSGPNGEFAGTGVTRITGSISVEDSSPTWNPGTSNATKDLRRELRIEPGATGELRGRNGTGSTGRLNASGFSAKLTNHGTLTIRDDQDIVTGICCPTPGGTGSFHNTGTLVKAAGTDPTNGAATGGGTSFIGLPSELDGVVDVSAGTLSVLGTGNNRHGADFRVAPGTTLDWSGGTHHLESAQGIHRKGGTGSAKTTFTGGTITLDAPYAMQQTLFEGGTARFNGATSPGPLTIASGRGDFNGATTVTTLLQTGGTLGGSAPLSFTDVVWRGGEQDTPLSGPHGDQPGTGVTEVTRSISIEDSSPTGAPTVTNDQKDLRRELRIVQGATAELKGRNGTGNQGRLNMTGFSSKLTNAGTFTIHDDQDIASGLCCVSPGGRGPIVNTGTLSKAGGSGESIVSAPLDQRGTVVAGVGRLRLDDVTAYSAATDTLGGATYIAHSTLAFDGPIATLAGDLVLDGADAAIDDATTTAAADGLAALASVAAPGKLTIRGGRNQTVPAFTSNGTVTVGEASTLTTPGTLQVGPTGTLSGRGTVAGAVRNAGIVAPGSSLGTLTVAGDYTQVAGGTLRSEIDPGGFDKLVVSGTAALGGTLGFAGTAKPAAGSTFRLVECGTCTGTFAGFTGEIIDADRSYGVDYGTGHVDAIVSRRAEPAIAMPDTATVTESTGATKTLTVEAGLAFPTDRTVTVTWAAGGGTATKPGDYTAAGGTLTFLPGQTKRPLEVTVQGDALDEADETLELTLSNPVNGTLATGDRTTAVTITDDDEQPSVALGADEVVEEPDAGDDDAVANVPVRLSAPSGRTVRVSYATSDGTASQPADYDAATGTVEFAPGETAKTIPVSVNGDDADEPAETLSVTLSNPVAAALGARGPAQVRIVDNDAAEPEPGPTPQVAVDDVTAGEGTEARFVVSLSTATTHAVTVQYATAAGTATTPGDFAERSGTLTFGPGATQRTVAVPTAGDETDEADERFTLKLSSPTGATAGTMTGTATIADDDDPPKVVTKVDTKVERVEVVKEAPPVQTLVARSVDPQYVGCVQRGTPFSYRFVFPLTRTDDRGRKIQRKARVVRVNVLFKGRSISKLTKAPFTASLDLANVEAGLHELVANAVLQAPKSKRTSTKQFRYLFQVCP